VLLASVEKAKFRRPVRPGDQLRMDMHVINMKSTAAKMRGEATVDGKLVAEAELMCVLADK
jgi:3-hydroxyacyl-[acyl-carrier-protein] dehydratase